MLDTEVCVLEEVHEATRGVRPRESVSTVSGLAGHLVGVVQLDQQQGFSFRSWRDPESP